MEKVLTENVHSIRANMSALVREEVLEGEPCFVCPVVMLVEGVHNGSGGSIFYSADELEKFPEAWNHKPVVLRHPNSEDGGPVSACSVDVVNTIKVGTLFNTVWENGRLKSEAWLLKARLAEVAPGVLAQLQAGLMLEVSTGLFFEGDLEPGDWQGESFERSARNIRPDHLAILVDEVGACSVADGAGMPRTNAQSRSIVMQVMVGRLWHMGSELALNVQSFNVIIDRLASVLRVEGGGDTLIWIEDVFVDRVVYSKAGTSDVLLVRGYTVREPAEVVLADISTVQEVRRVTEYVTLNVQLEKGNRAMGNIAGEGKEQVKDGSRFAAAVERRVGANMDKALDKVAGDLLGTANVDADKNKGGEGEVPAVNANPDDPPKDIDAVIAAAPELLQAEMKEAMAHLREKRATLATELAANENCDFTQGELEAKPLEELTKLHKLVSAPVANAGDNLQPKPNYSASGTGAEQKETPLIPPSMNAEDGDGDGDK